ncbi:conserved exported protein of unknown function [Oenococcus oeni]|uniref:PTS EIIB type-3 domain-containing protein n=1 Tax=Oenococcus oeni TaxID=1247 RepID=A0AAQ2UTV7_OENOE|nr:PTS sugar transporter subunit IIB [Oenococcus oeni]SYW03808.1 conserved exported hypothetical protein [Oenococcus oeni]VDB98831.1 conserved exported protein of unknown function [Oenococcus oeni]
MKNILLICGSGASSGFMAAAIRKAAKKQGVELKVKASSESQLDDMIDDTDILLIGPHLSYMLDDLKTKISGKDVKVAVIPQAVYGSLNGPKALEMISEMEN